MQTFIRNGKVVTPDAVLEGFDVVLEDRDIAAVVPSGSFAPSAGAELINADSCWVMPGLIDIHADFIENMAAPRPTSVMDMALAFREAERVLTVHGITTMFHSISFISNLHAFSTPIRAPELTRRLLHCISESHESPHLIHHRFHARFEIDSVGPHSGNQRVHPGWPDPSAVHHGSHAGAGAVPGHVGISGHNEKMEEPG